MEISLRLTTDDLKYEDLENVFGSITQKYIIALEHPDSNRHFQCYLHMKDDFREDNKMSKIRYLIKKSFPQCSGPGKQSVTRMKNDNLKVYVLKEDNNARYKGFTEEEIKGLREQSYEKDLPYKELLKKLEEDFFLGLISNSDLVTQYIQLRIRFGLLYNRLKAKDWYQTQLLKRFPEKLLTEVRLVTGGDIIKELS